MKSNNAQGILRGMQVTNASFVHPNPQVSALRMAVTGFSATLVFSPHLTTTSVVLP
ncbi:MAG: hypothetical protein KUG83_04665 [Gammaproteobacteria bacterium]|nr:hypothetical protein [Gammaproteobacteria bacterium]